MFEFVLAIAEFMCIFNGEWWRSQATHYCFGWPGCCRDAAHTKSRMVSALKARTHGLRTHQITEMFLFVFATAFVSEGL